MVLLLFWSGNLSAGEDINQRVWVGLDMFSSLLTAELDITEKKDADNQLLLLLMYVDNRETAGKMAGYLEKIETIRGVRIKTELTDDTSLKTYKKRQIAGIFLSQKIKQNLGSIIQQGKKRHIIVFSPFEEDVEQGITGGIIISDTIRPYINMETIRESGIRIKPFFFRGAKQYESRKKIK
jgi:hypothetical protein